MVVQNKVLEHDQVRRVSTSRDAGMGQSTGEQSRLRNAFVQEKNQHGMLEKKV